MTHSFNLPPGVSFSAVSSEHECPTCGGYGTIERVERYAGREVATEEVTCSTCSGLGVVYMRAKGDYNNAN